MRDTGRSGYSNGKPFVETATQAEGEYVRTVEYLIDNGQRFRVAVDMRVDSPDIRNKIGHALANRERGRTR